MDAILAATVYAGAGQLAAAKNTTGTGRSKAGECSKNGWKNRRKNRHTSLTDPSKQSPERARGTSSGVADETT